MYIIINNLILTGLRLIQRCGAISQQTLSIALCVSLQCVHMHQLGAPSGSGPWPGGGGDGGVVGTRRDRMAEISSTIEGSLFAISTRKHFASSSESSSMMSYKIEKHHCQNSIDKV